MIPKISSDRFLWTEKSGVIEVSEMPPAHWETSFIVVSEKTGEEVRFVFDHQIIGGTPTEREVDGWKFLSFDGEFSITIYND